MNILVFKFGGTSVGSGDGRARASRHVRRALDAGFGVVAVVSAMGRAGDPYATDTLLGLAPDAGALTRDLLMSSGETISACVFADELERG
ncbi:MAG: hypothetical protein LBQ56_02745, partial [Synergistaceae bacterium]|nr:hypothetical protein [Synergistaceae bacterium]